MKKFLISLSAILLVATNSYSSKVLSSDRTLYDKWFTAKALINEVEGRYNYEEDIAVISDSNTSTELALQDALYGLESAIASQYQIVFNSYIYKANLLGPGFNEQTSKQLSKVYAKEIIQKGLYNVEGVWEDKSTKRVFVLVKLKKDIVNKDATKQFSDRLVKVIDALIELRKGINND